MKTKNMSEFAEKDFISEYEYIGCKTEKEIFDFYDKLNTENYHSISRDDICTPMLCVKKMLDYIPQELWQRKELKVLDPCCGNGNFGAYCMSKTSNKNIYYNELNNVRLQNCINLLNPNHYRCGDVFTMDGEFDTTYDLIMGNPPYSGGGNKNQSLSNLFIIDAINRLNKFGYLCFVTPNNWMSYNNNNETLKKLLTEGSFIVIDNDVKKYFPGVGSSFTIFVWQKGVFDNKTKIVNNYLVKDIQENVEISKDLKYIPLYISQKILNIILKITSVDNNNFTYRCDLHNFTKKDLLSDIQDEKFVYETIHTARKTRYATIKQDIYDKWIIVVPLSTYYIPFVKHNVNTTQSVGYFQFETKKDAEQYLKIITQPIFKLIVHLTRYGNFNNIMVLKHLKFDEKIVFTEEEICEIKKLVSYIKY